MSNFDSLFASELARHAEVLEAMRGIAPAFAMLCTAAVATFEAGGRVLFFGNGGSAADAQHLATELTVRYRRNRRALAAIALTTDTSALTAIGNDFGFDALFARQIEALGRGGDLAVGISTSGRSPNVLAGLRQARDQGLTTVAFTGIGGLAEDLADITIAAPSSVTARIQEMHILVGHMFCEAMDEHFA
ncbi:MAG: D-sedoheptulose 7-phosphate isomerase [Rhodobacter sp.]|jgi:D-sedoheptulose 7-phosphate isomerase|nr:D-sedoheptulose 7-phosphate isomerase [Rhodobacter sp.]